MQINRLFEIIYILLDKRKVTAKELAKYFEVSIRTIYRDIEVLSGAGIPVYMSKGKGGGVALLSEFVLDKTVITETEKKEILSSLKAVDSVKPGGEDTVLRKLGSLFGDIKTDWIEVDFGAWSGGDREETLFKRLKEAVIGENVVRFSYASVKGQETERYVEPIKLLFKGGAWYLYGYCRKRKDYRCFKLKRIHNLKLTEENFLRKCKVPVLKKEMCKQHAEMVKLKLKLEKEAAYRVYDEFEVYEQLGDGSFMAEIDFPGNEWLLYYIFSFGRYVEVIEPEEVRVRLKEELGRMLDKYILN